MPKGLAGLEPLGSHDSIFKLTHLTSAPQLPYLTQPSAPRALLYPSLKGSTVHTRLGTDPSLRSPVKVLTQLPPATAAQNGQRDTDGMKAHCLNIIGKTKEKPIFQTLLGR